MEALNCYPPDDSILLLNRGMDEREALTAGYRCELGGLAS